MIEIKKCLTDADFSYALRITHDYMDWLEMDLSFQDIGKELKRFPAMYGEPQGLFLLAWKVNELAGGVGLRTLAPRICEMKRLYVYDAYKGQGVGRQLCNALIKEALRLGFHKMRLDTLDRMTPAITLYRSLGFEEIASYRFNPDPTARFFELDLKTIDSL